MQPSEKGNQPEILEDDPRIGKHARYSRGGEFGIIKRILRYPDGTEVMRVEIGLHGIQSVSTDFEIVDNGKEERKEHQ